MKTKHTPGPWKFEKMLNPPKAKDRTCGFVVNGPDAEPLPDRICDLRVPPGMRFSEYQANARLIAAAPELLEVVKALVSAGGIMEPSDWFVNARAALAKVTGES